MDFELPAAWFLNGESSPTLLAYGVIFAVGGVAGGVNVLAGGGSFLTLPLLIFLGLPPSVANGTNRIGIFLQNLFAVWGFQRHDVLDWQALRWAALPAVVGAPLGTWLALSTQEATFQKVLAFLMVGITLWTLVEPSRGKIQGGVISIGKSGIPDSPRVFHDRVLWRVCSGRRWLFNLSAHFLVGFGPGAG